MAFDAFLKLSGITGEGIRSKHKGEIAIHSFSWGGSQSVSHGQVGGGGGGQASLSSFNVSKNTDKASPDIAQSCFKGKHFPKAIVTLRKSGGTASLAFLKYEFTDVFIDSYSQSGSSGGSDTPDESVSFVFGDFTMTYQPQKDDGTNAGEPVVGYYNLKDPDANK